jgi:hypothetical protein
LRTPTDAKSTSPASAGATRLAPQRPADLKTRRAGLPGWLLAVLALVLLGAVGTGVGLALNAFGGDTPPQTGPVSEADVRGVVGRFARAYEKEDAEALGRTLASYTERVLPGDRQSGRSAVVAVYRGQFKGSAVKRYVLDVTGARGGDVGRATGRYRVERAGEPPFGGEIVFSVTRERGRARIALIAARPDA